MQDFSDLSAILFVEPLMATHCLNALEIHVELGPALSIDIYTDYTYTVRGLHHRLKFF